MQTLAPTWNLDDTATTKWYVRLFPSLNDIAFLLPIIVLFAKMNGTQLLFADGDTGWHIRTGEWIWAHRAVPTTDIFSFTKPNHAWFAWEWAWDLTFAAVHHLAGLAGVGFVTTLMLGIFTLLVYRLALRVSHNNVMSMAVTALTAAASSIHWLARPHLVSWIFAIIFLNAIQSAQAGHRRLLYLLPVAMVFWVNLHGGFIAGLIILGCYALGDALTVLAEGKSLGFIRNLSTAWQRSAPYWKSLGLCAAATLVNPYGWQLHKHIFGYLADSELLDKIQEFQSISFHAGPAILFEIMLMLAAFAVFSKLQCRQFSPVLLICLWAHLALLSARHIPLFMIVSAPFVAGLLSSALQHAREIPVLASASEALTDICNELRAVEFTPRLHLASAGALLVIASLFAIGQGPFVPQFNAEAFPVQAAIPLLEHHMGSRVFTTDQWADYLLYRMYPAQRVFFDGRSDFYGNEFIKVNQRIASAEHDWKSLLQRYAIDLVVLKPETPLSAVLKLTPGSKVLLDDGKVIVFDTSHIYQPILGKGDTVKRAARVSQSLHSAPPGDAVTAHRTTKSQKGKTS
jgi:hypothetical protein